VNKYMKNIMLPMISFLVSVCSVKLLVWFSRLQDLYDPVTEYASYIRYMICPGSIGVVTGFCTAVTAYSFMTGSAFAEKFLPLVVSGCIIFLVGLAGDIAVLPGKIKLLFRAVPALITVLSGYGFMEIYSIHLTRIESAGLSFLWIFGCTNAFNLLDGTDGQCGVLSVLILLFLGAVYYRSIYPLEMLCFVLAASVAGVLVYNFNPVKITLGNSGSQFLGFMIAVIPIAGSSGRSEYNKFFLLLILVSIPVLNTLSVLWRCMRQHRSFSSASLFLLDHELQNIGCSRCQILILLCATQGLLCVCAGLSVYLNGMSGNMLLCIVYAFMILLAGFVHFASLAVTRVQKENTR
jgi:UDP-GlcNAc:undecaprenyl-phosphate/decaprenyl-phosphate GlcNAc-1-phosphate transferase